MPSHITTLQKLIIEANQPAQYFLQLKDNVLPLNELLDTKIKLTHSGNKYCIQCNRKTSKTFQQGYCFPCYRRLQECDCMLRPEKCRINEGICKPDDWAHAQCFGDHIVYLANASGIKVGITRKPNVPSRWLDQGAIQALPIFETKNRLQAGLVEVVIKQYISDKTNWRAMLKANPESINLFEQRDIVYDTIEKELKTIQNTHPEQITRIDSKAYDFSYPIIQFPEKIHSLNLDKDHIAEGKLQGMKGQYLFLSGNVINIRKFGGYEVELNY